ncbi:MAG: hypothetical protein L3J93_04835 [Thermoplasmata archaeon]|nr:hypothetical protein [Thermoplasmata archaeon]
MIGTATRVEEARLIDELRSALRSAREPVQGIEVGIALSIALGRQRPAVSCGGCATPLEFEGVPAMTNVRLRTPFRLLLATAHEGS